MGDAQTGWAVGTNGLLLMTEDGGESWQELRQGFPQQHSYDVVFRHALDIDGNTLIFGTTTGNLFISEDRGDHWTSIGSYFPPIYSVRLCNWE